MLRHFTKPRYARFLHRHFGIEPFCNRVGDSGLALFSQQGDELFLLGNQCVDFGGFATKESRDGNLLVNGGKWNDRICQI